MNFKQIFFVENDCNMFSSKSMFGNANSSIVPEIILINGGDAYMAGELIIFGGNALPTGTLIVDGGNSRSTI